MLANACANPDSLADVPAIRALKNNVGDWSEDDWPEWESLNYVARIAYDRGRDATRD